MGGRVKAVAAGGRKAKGRRAAKDDESVQRPGKLMLNNPLIPAHMDEDIDDDLAFDSEDEALYGQFFNKAASKGKRASRAGRAVGDEGDEDLSAEQFDAIGKTERRRKKRRRAGHDDDEEEQLYNYREEGQTSDDDDDEHLDLSDMFDLAMQNQSQEAGGTAKKKKPKPKSSVAAHDTDADVLMDESASRHVKKKRRGTRVTEEAESLYGMADAGVDGGAGSFSSALRTIVKADRSGSEEEAAAAERLRVALSRRHNLLSVDTDDPSKDRATRREVRAVVEQSLQKYKPLLRELNTAKHVKLPMKLPDSVPTPSSIGGIVTAAKASAGVAGTLASRVGALLSRAGLAREQLQGNTASSEDPTATAAPTNSIGDYVEFGEGEGAGEGLGEGGEGDAPSRGYVAKLKAMLAYEISRRKRFNRIKSKTYRRILRKEKDRERERREKAFELLHPELARKRLAEKLLKARALERVTQKHKNTSAWVKHAKRFASFDANAKDAIDEQHALHQRLMQRMEREAGEDNYERYVGDGAESAVSSEEERVVDELLAAAQETADRGAAATRATSALWQSVEAGAGGTSVAMEKARAELGSMKFMKAAREREEKHYEEEMRALQDDVRRYQAGEEVTASDSDVDGEQGGDRAATTRDGVPAAPVGRRSFQPTQSSTSAAREGPATVESIQLKKQSGLRAGASSSSSSSSGGGRVDGVGEPDDASSVLSVSDGWEVDGPEEDDAGESREEPRLPRDAKARKTVAAGKAKRGGGGSSKDAQHAGEFAGLRKATAAAAAGTKTSKKATASTRVVVRPGGHSLQSGPTSAPAESAVGGGEAEMTAEDLRAQQEYLISRAFAHDDVDEEFLKDKEAQVEAIMRPEDRNENLPGWGEWGGEDEGLNKRHQEKLSHSTMQRQIEKSFLMKSRADAALDHVIINHDGVELVPDRMTLHMIPRPFSNPKEFARSMRQPLGPEWSSAMGFKDGVQPRVEVRQGHSVLPLDISLRGKKRSVTKRRKTDAKK